MLRDMRQNLSRLTIGEVPGYILGFSPIELQPRLEYTVDTRLILL